MDAAGRSLLVTICAGTLLACGGGSADTAVVGAEGSACYPNGTCNPGLTCLSTFCVRVVLDGGDSDGQPPDTTHPNATDGGSDVAPAPPFTPAAHPALPQVATLGGPVLVKPKVQPIVYANDTGAADIETFLKDLTHIAYWNETTAEYGVGPLTVLPAISIDTTAPPQTSDDMLRRSQLAANTAGANPVWGQADPSIIYLFVVPEGSSVNHGKSTCCYDFGGYHSEAPAGATTVPYAVGCSCPGFLGFTFTGLQTRTVAISHELIETATDPFPNSNPAYQLEDRADIIWEVITGGEVADMCAFNDDAYYVPTGTKYMVQRSWSNAAARATQNPCVPHTTSAPYFNSFPALESVALGDATYLTRGVQIPIGQSKTIDVTLFSNAATTNTWAVSAVDYDYWVRGLAPNLILDLDKSEGRNGDTVHLTITPKNADPDIGAEAFIILSHYGGVRDPDYQTNMTMGFVTN